MNIAFFPHESRTWNCFANKSILFSLSDQGCITDFENTAAFSRDYQASQECMCDGEHMFDCPAPKDSNKSNRQMTSELESFLARQFGNKNFVAKKYGYEVSV